MNEADAGVVEASEYAGNLHPGNVQDIGRAFARFQKFLYAAAS